MGCARGSSTATTSTTAAASDGPGDCTPAALGLASATPLSIWKHGCKLHAAGSRTLARSEQELAAVLDCGASSGVDFSKNAVLVEPYTLSPAGAGLDAYDDGHTVTLVGRQRPNCQGDPMPMPMQQVLAFLVPAGASREIASKTCTLSRSCP